MPEVHLVVKAKEKCQTDSGRALGPTPLWDEVFHSPSDVGVDSP